MGGTFQIISHAYLETLKDISHDGDVPDLLFAIGVVPYDLVQAVESDDQTVSIAFQMLIVVLKNVSEVLKFAIGDSFEHVFQIAGEVEQ